MGKYLTRLLQLIPQKHGAGKRASYRLAPTLFRVWGDMKCDCKDKSLLDEYPWFQSLYMCTSCRRFWFREGVFDAANNFMGEYRFWEVDETGYFVGGGAPRIDPVYLKRIQLTLARFKGEKDFRYIELDLKEKSQP